MSSWKEINVETLSLLFNIIKVCKMSDYTCVYSFQNYATLLGKSEEGEVILH